MSEHMGDAPRGTGYLLMVFSSATLMFVAGLALLILMLGAVIGPFNFFGISHAPGARGIGLWHLESLNEVASPETRRRRDAWTEMLPPDLPVVHSFTLGDLENAGLPVVGLPDSRQLSFQQANDLVRYIRGGGAVVLAGSVGVRDSENAWRGYGVMRSLLQVSEVEPIQEQGSSFIAAATRGPLSSGLAPGERLRLLAEPGVPAIHNPLAELRWNTEALELREAGPAASKRLELGQGRLVWLALGPENAVSDVEEDRRAMERVLQSAVLWAIREPLLEVLPWPGGAPFAALLTTNPMDAVDGRPVPSAAELQDELFGRLGIAEQSGEFLEVSIPVDRLPEDEGAALVRLARDLLTDRGAWVPTRSEVQRWSGQQAMVSTRLTRSGPNRIRLDVTNRGDEDLEGVVLRVHFNQSVTNVLIQQTAVGQERPELSFRPGDGSADLELPKLPRKASRAYTVDFASS